MQKFRYDSREESDAPRLSELLRSLWLLSVAQSSAGAQHMLRHASQLRAHRIVRVPTVANQVHRFAVQQNARLAPFVLRRRRMQQMLHASIVLQARFGARKLVQMVVQTQQHRAERPRNVVHIVRPSGQHDGQFACVQFRVGAFGRFGARLVVGLRTGFSSLGRSVDRRRTQMRLGLACVEDERFGLVHSGEGRCEIEDKKSYVYEMKSPTSSDIFGVFYSIKISIIY